MTSAVRKAGRGSWPAGCDPDHPGIHVFTVYFDTRSLPSHWGKDGDPNSVFEQAWEKCRRAYARIGILMLRVNSKSKANTSVTWVRGNGWIGLAQLPNAPGCGSKVWARFDNRYKPSDLVNMLARLLAHEFGHNWKLRHTRGGIMNSSIVRGSFNDDAWVGDPSQSTLVRYSGGKSIDLDDDGPDPPDPPGPPDPPNPPGPSIGNISGFLTVTDPVLGDVQLTVNDGVGKFLFPKGRSRQGRSR